MSNECKGKNEKGGRSMKRLIQKAQRGNDQAFLKIFQHYEADLYRMAYVYVKIRMMRSTSCKKSLIKHLKRSGCYGNRNF